MNKTISSNFKFLIEDFNDVAKKPSLIKKLRDLTLCYGSGMNIELDHLLATIKERKVNCRIIKVISKTKLVAWALLSRESSSFKFSNTWDRFDPSIGTLFEVYVHPDYRRMGIGSELIKIARKRSGSMTLCIAPWDSQSRGFFLNFERYKHKKL
jgi:GNAT superfamily N-acetyltransferase